MDSDYFRVVVPVRYASQRLPGKPLLQANGCSILQYVYNNAVASGALSVTIATDDERIYKHAAQLGADVLMTSSEHLSGTDRIAEVTRKLGWHEQEIVVNLQGDEPQMAAANIRQVAKLLIKNSSALMATLCYPITDKQEFDNPNCVKTVFDKSGRALYFSRSPIPYARTENPVIGFRHLGIYAYRVEYLQEFSTSAATPLEQTECLEQLRALENGKEIMVAISDEPPGIGIDTAEDFENFQTHLDGK